MILDHKKTNIRIMANYYSIEIHNILITIQTYRNILKEIVVLLYIIIFSTHYYLLIIVDYVTTIIKNCREYRNQAKDNAITLTIHYYLNESIILGIIKSKVAIIIHVIFHCSINHCYFYLSFLYVINQDTSYNIFYHFIRNTVNYAVTPYTSEPLQNSKIMVIYILF